MKIVCRRKNRKGSSTRSNDTAMGEAAARAGGPAVLGAWRVRTPDLRASAASALGRAVDRSWKWRQCNTLDPGNGKESHATFWTGRSYMVSLAIMVRDGGARRKRQKP
jgi:hypothetical protein